MTGHFFESLTDIWAKRLRADGRSRLPWAIFDDMLRRAFRPQAERQHREASWCAWRPVALDGTQFSLNSTPQVLAALTKAHSRSRRAAYFWLTMAVMFTAGLHKSLAARRTNRSGR